MEKYIILSARSMDSLATLVNKAIDTGYTPHGSPVSTLRWNYQAMLLKDTQRSAGPTEIKSRSKN